MFKIESLRTEGKKGLEDLCKLCEELNGGREKYGQLQLNNGSYVSGLLNFMENNPGIVRAMYEWIGENYEEELVKECENCGDDLEAHSEEEIESCGKAIREDDMLKAMGR